MWRGAYLAALAPGCGRTSYKLPPPPTLTRKKGQNLGFSASLTPIWENAPENITTYFQGPPLPGFHVSFCILRKTIQGININSQRIWARFWLIKRRLLKYVFAKKYIFKEKNCRNFTFSQNCLRLRHCKCYT